ncbi:MAG: DUF72 domain-containing protein [Candidatus Micrarchaeaceae archaeon]
MKAFVGTSGWLYGWNKESSLEWYAKNSGLNAIELNASFYRFPFPNQVVGWRKTGGMLRWSIKVNRIVTHIHMLNDKAIATYEKFIEIFKPLDDIVEFYLFQMPPRFSILQKERLEDFVKSFDQKRIALEFRNRSWYDFDFDKMDFGGAIVSPDSPEISRIVFAKNGLEYIRFHGRRYWYSYKYSKGELEEMADLAIAKKPRKIMAFFNNNHDMLANAREFASCLKGLETKTKDYYN